MIAALFVDSNGVYASLRNVDVWGADRDARNYRGPHPVVAHPPCQLWGKYAPLNFRRWGGEHNRPGNDGGCFASALHDVRTHGGVLEHPAFTKAWAAHNLTPPQREGGWKQSADREWVCEVWQSAYGHLARKRTWLFYSGTTKPFDLDWSQQPGTHQIGHDSQRHTNKPILRGKAASATPLAFAEALVRLAEMSNK